MASGEAVGVSGGDVGSAAVRGVSRWASLRSGVDGRRLGKCLFLAIGERWETTVGVSAVWTALTPVLVPVSKVLGVD